MDKQRAAEQKFVFPRLKGQREYKDRLFRYIFGKTEHREWLLSLYNAISKTDYTNPDDIDLKILDDVIYIGMKNDISFIIDHRFIFFEQQSTFCPNMPARIFIYMGVAYQYHIYELGNLIYADKLVGLPLPKCYCFYNGPKDKEDRFVLKLSDAFKKGTAGARHGLPAGFETPDIEVSVTMLNINYGHNQEILDACKPLKEYSWFCDTVRNYCSGSGMELALAIDRALDEMPKDFLIRPYLIKNRGEVKCMCLTEFDEVKTLNALAEFYEAEGRAEGEVKGRAEGEVKGRAEGEVKGRTEGKLETLAGLVDDGILTLEQAAQRAGMTIPVFKEKVAQLETQRIDV